MFCPNCGINNIEERNYCNNCGTSIQIIKRVTKMAKNMEASKIDQIKQAYNLEKEWNNSINKGLFVIGSGLIYSVAIFTIGFLVKKYFHQDIGRLLKDLSIFGVLFITIGAMIIAYGRLKLRTKNTELALSEILTDETPQLDKARNSMLASGEDYNFETYTPLSVVENTTKELKKAPATPRSLKDKLTS